MGSWSVAAASAGGDGAAEEVVRPVAAVTAVARLDGGAWLDVELAGAALLDVGLGDTAVPLGTAVELRREGGDNGGLEFLVTGGAEVGGGRRAVRMMRKEHLGAGGAATVDGDGWEVGRRSLWQRAKGQGAWDFLGRTGSSVCLAERLDVRDGKLEVVEEACPVGWCVVTEGGVSGEGVLKGVVDALSQRHLMVAGLVRTVAESRYRLAGVYEGKEDRGQRVDLSAGGEYWKPVGAEAGGEFESMMCCRVTSSIGVEDPDGYLEGIFDGERRSLGKRGVDGRESHLCPVGPCTVWMGGEAWFAVETSIRIGLERGANGDGEVVRTLALVRSGALRGGRRRMRQRFGGGTTLIGVVEEPAKEGAVVLLGPPGPGTVDERVRFLACWDAPLGVPIAAVQAGPGFVGESGWGLYAPLRVGDLVVFDVGGGGTVVVRGGVHRPIEEAGEATISIIGERLVLKGDVRIEGKVDVIP